MTFAEYLTIIAMVAAIFAAGFATAVWLIISTIADVLAELLASGRFRLQWVRTHGFEDEAPER